MGYVIVGLILMVLIVDALIATISESKNPEPKFEDWDFDIEFVPIVFTNVR